MDADIKELFEVLIKSQIQTDHSINGLAKSVTSYVDASNAGMERLEENLDGLIRAIAREHTNGGSHR